jgi:hypothetical protein
MKKLFKPLIGIIFLGWLFGMMAVRQYYTRHRPESPQPELSRTVAVQLNYGKTVYVTPEENRILVFASEGLLVALLITIIVFVFRNNKSKQNDEA